MPPLVTITAGARNSKSPTAFRDDATPRGSVRRLQHRTAHADHRAVGDDQLVDLVPVRERHLGVVAQPPREDLDDRGAGAPGDVEPRHRVAVPRAS